MIHDWVRQVKRSAGTDSRITAGLREALLLKAVHYARLPETAQSYVTDSRVRIIEALTPADETAISKQLGPQFAWAASLWRITPTDSRSLERAAQSAELMARIVDVVRDVAG
jgi:hypothetical protein